MKRLQRFSDTRPITFGLASTLIYIFIILVISILSGVVPGGDLGRYIGGGIGRLVLLAVLLFLLQRFGWYRSTGFNWPEGGDLWLLMLLPLAYAVVASVYALTGALSFRLTDPSVDGVALLFIMISAVTEEVMFRGLVLQSLVRPWGPSTSGLIRAVIASSLFFCSIHLVNVLGGELALDTLLQAVGAIWLGITLGGLTLKTGSLYPAIVLHAALNISGYLALSAISFTPNSSAWALYSVMMIPLAVYGIYLLRARRHPLWMRGRPDHPAGRQISR